MPRLTHENAHALAKMVRSGMKRKGWTQEKLAEMADVTVDRVSHLSLCPMEISEGQTEEVGRVCAKLGLDVEKVNRICRFVYVPDLGDGGEGAVA